MATDHDSKPLVKDLHEHIVCPLCRGYLIDATTLVECLHSFCRGCIVRRLGSGARACPVCGAATLPPLLPDLALQRLVYLSVPGLFRSELERRRHFRAVNPQCPPLAPPLGALTLTLEDSVSLSLREIPADGNKETEIPGRKSRDAEVGGTNGSANEDGADRKTRYLKCPAGVSVRHLVRLLALKRGWGETDQRARLKRIEMLYECIDKRSCGERSELRVLELSWTLLDLACIFKWDKESPMKVYYRVVDREEIVPIPMSATETNPNDIVAGRNAMENVQRPPTPPPSPKQSGNIEMVPPSAHLSLSPPPPPPAPSAPSPSPVLLPPSSPSASRLPQFLEPLPPTLPDSPTSPTSPSTPISPKSQVPSSDSSMIAPVASPPETRSSNNSKSLTGSLPCSVTERRETKTKKPRCEVTPVMRAPGPLGGGQRESTKPGKVARMEQHKRRKHRNKRLIAEITTTPREDLLKLKVRLTPCPPRITSSSGNAKEKLLQMRAVRRDKVKSVSESVRISRESPPLSSSIPPPPPPSPPPPPPPPLPAPSLRPPQPSPPLPAPPTVQPSISPSPLPSPSPPPSPSQSQSSRPSSTSSAPPSTSSPSSTTENVSANVGANSKIAVKDDCADREETIEDIIDCIPDEVVRVAQNLIPPASEKDKNNKVPAAAVIPETIANHAKEQQYSPMKATVAEKAISGSHVGKPKSEEVLRRLGLVAVGEAAKTLQDKMKHSRGSPGIDYHRESLERQLRESKANRVRSLLAEKQMRDALKSIMSKTTVKVSGSGLNGSGPKKGPPPLAPLTLNKPPGSFSSTPPKTSHPAIARPPNAPRTAGSAGSRANPTPKNETPLDLSSGAQNALDLSPTPVTSTVAKTSVDTSEDRVRSKVTAGPDHPGKAPEEKKNQDLNLRTLSDAAVSLLTTGNGIEPHGTSAAAATGNVTVGNKVALRIPQPPQRLSGFGNGIKIKPNLGVRHIPNPQAFVASQYRNQRMNFFTSHQQQ